MSIKWPIRNVLLFKNWRSIYKGNLTLKLRNGLSITLPSKHNIPIIWEVFGQGQYSALKELSKNKKAEKPVIVDLGAHIGCFTLYALLQIPDAIVYSYEPSKTNFDLLQYNLRQNGKNATIYHEAVAGTAGTVKLLIAGGGDSGHNTIRNDTGIIPESIEQVPSTTLNEVIKRAGGHIDFLKIDIEDAEIEVLENASLDNVKSIVVEGEPSALIRLLSKRGYQVSEPMKGIVVGKR